MAKQSLNNRNHHTIMGDDVNHELFSNPNIKIQHNGEAHNNDATNVLLNGITLMGLDSDSKPLRYNHYSGDHKNDDLEDDPDCLPSDKSGSITLMGSSSDLKFNDHENNKHRHQNGFTLMGNTDLLSKPQSAKKKTKHKTISSESYWRMFVFQQPHLFTHIMSFLYPFQRLLISNVANFMNEFIVHSQLKYMKQNQTIKLKTNWTKYDVIHYDMDLMIWNNSYSVLIDNLNYKSLVLSTHTMHGTNVWNSDRMKQLKYYLVNQLKLSIIYDFMERNKMHHIHDDEYNTPLSQTLHNITHLYCTDYDSSFGMNGTMFCSDLLSSCYCNIQSLYLSNNALDDACIDVFCNRLLSSHHHIASSLIHLDLSDNIRITGQCVEILFTLIGEKCNRLNTLNLSRTSVDDRVCDAIYDYYRCYYGSSVCNVRYIHLMDNKCITIQGLHKLNQVFQSIITDPRDDHKFNVLKCLQLQYRFDYDYRIIVSPQCERHYIDKRAKYMQGDVQ
eukprot:22698_1